MAQVTNPDGTVSEFKIGQDEALAEVTVKLNKDGTPRKQRGPKKIFTGERKAISAFIDLQDHNKLVADFGSGTKAITALNLYKQSKGI